MNISFNIVLARKDSYLLARQLLIYYKSVESVLNFTCSFHLFHMFLHVRMSFTSTKLFHMLLDDGIDKQITVRRLAGTRSCLNSSVHMQW